MTLDPKGYYARLSVDPRASPEAIRTAFRRRARRLHPDVPDTGDAMAFIELKQAYDVLSDPEAREAYDRASWPLSTGEPEPVDPYDRPPPEPVEKPPPPRGPSLGRWVFVVAAATAVLGILEASRWMGPVPPSAPTVSIRPNAPAVPPRPLAPDAEQTGVRSATGVTDYFTVPTPGPTVLWKLDKATRNFSPGRHLPPFTPVESLRILPRDGLVEVRLPDGETGFLMQSRLVAGDAGAARLEACHTDPGPTVPNGELLVYRTPGPAPLAVRNQGTYPAVVKLRNERGETAASVFLLPGGTATVNLPRDVVLRVDFAVGPLFSRRCNAFSGGMLARRFPDAARVASLTPLVVPPDAAMTERLTEIPESVFNRD